MRALTPAQETLDHFSWIAPSGEALHRTFRIAEWPATGIQEMWDNLSRLDLIFRVRSSFWPSSFQISPSLHRKINRLEMNLKIAANENDTNVLPRDEELKDYQEILIMRDQVVFHHESLVDEITFVTISSPDESTLNADCNKFLDVTSAYGVTAVPVSGCQQPGAIHTTLLAKAKLLALDFWHRWTMVPRRAASLIPRGFGFAGDGTGIYVGHTVDLKSPVNLDILRAINGFASNMIIFGMTGSGKSFWMKILILSAWAMGAWIIIFDVDGEYRELCENLGGLWMDLAGTSGKFPDPCIIPAKSLDEEENLMRYSRMRDNIARSFELIGDLEDLEIAEVEKAVIRVYDQHGIYEDKPETWDTEHDIVLKDIYMDCPENVKTKCWRGFEGGLAKYFSEPIRFQGQPNRLVVFHLGNPDIVTNAKVTGIKFSMAIDTSWEWLIQNRKLGRQTVIDSDEGQRVILKPKIGDYLAGLVTTIRKWNGVMLLATNTPSQLWTTDLGDKIWDNTPIKVIFALEEDKVQHLSKVVRLPPGVEAAIRRQFGTHTASIRCRDGSWIQVEADIPESEEKLYATRT